MSFLLSKATSAALGQGARYILGRLRVDQARLDQVREEIYEEIALETQARAADLEAKHGELVRVVAEKLTDREILVLAVQLHEQARTSAMRERLRLMCSAIAGIFTPDLDVETKSRVARILTQLEVSDAVLLRRIEQDRPMYTDLLNSSPLGLNLLAVLGCVEYDNAPGALRSKLTPLGAALLKMIETWTPEEAPAP